MDPRDVRVSSRADGSSAAGCGRWVMRVLVNALPLRHGGGVAFVQQQLRALARVDPDLELHTLVSPWSQLRDIPGMVETVPVPSVPARFAYEQFVLPWRSADVLYCPANFGPVMSRAPVVLTVHNAHYYRAGFAQSENKPLRPPWKVMANHLAMRRAKAVVAVSRTLAADVSATMPGVAHKLFAVHGWCARVAIEVDADRRAAGSITCSVSRVRRRTSEVGDVVLGWARARELTGVDAALCIVGEVTRQQLSEFRVLAGTHWDRLVFLGLIKDRSVLKAVYEGAAVMVSMSTLESLSMTPSEAGSVGCPMVLSDIPVASRVRRGCRQFVPARDVDVLARVLAAGLPHWAPRSKPWVWPGTWDDNAREVLRIFRSVESSRDRLRQPGRWAQRKRRGS